MTNDELIARAEALCSDLQGRIDATKLGLIAELIAALKASEARVTKLEEALEVLNKIKRIDNLVGVFAACERTIAELAEGKK